MRAQFEKVRSDGSSFVAFERNDPSFPFLWHYHPEYELTLIVESHGQRLVGDGVADYGPGDVVLLGPNLPHTWRSVPAAVGLPEIHRAVVVQFLPDFLGEEFFRLQEMVSVVRLLFRSSCGLAFGSTAAGKSVAKSLAKLPTLSPARRLTTLLSILVELSEEPGAQQLSAGNIKPMCRAEDQKRIDAICSYLNRHFKEEIDYPALARQIHVDLASLCRLFKRATGRTMTSYVNGLRVAAAAQLLRDTDLSALEIGLSVGFGNYSNFNRQFKRMKGIGPRILRRRFQAAGN